MRFFARWMTWSCPVRRPAVGPLIMAFIVHGPTGARPSGLHCPSMAGVPPRSTCLTRVDQLDSQVALAWLLQPALYFSPASPDLWDLDCPMPYGESRRADLVGLPAGNQP